VRSTKFLLHIFPSMISTVWRSKFTQWLSGTKWENHPFKSIIILFLPDQINL